MDGLAGSSWAMAAVTTRSDALRAQERMRGDNMGGAFFEGGRVVRVDGMFLLEWWRILLLTRRFSAKKIAAVGP